MASSSSIVDDCEQEQKMLDAIEKRLEGSVRPHVLRLEHADEYPLEMVERIKPLGLFGAMIGSECGGLDLKAGPAPRLSRRSPAHGCHSAVSSTAI